VSPAGEAARTLYRRWILANGWSEAVGLGTTFLVGRAVAPWLGAFRPAGVLLSAVAAVVLGTLLEGTVVGAAQARVVRDALPGLRRRGWVYATMLGAGAAWLLGMVPSTVMAFASADRAGAPLAEPPALVQYGLAALLGFVAGPVLGSAQWLVLRRHRCRAGLWLWANACAWAVGMPLIFLGMELVPWEQGGIAAAAAIYGVCGVAGLAVGAIHGRVLLLLVFAKPEGAGPRTRPDVSGL
jgi:hypothetical protein